MRETFGWSLILSIENLLDCGCFIQSELKGKVIFEAKQVINFDERLQRQSCTLE